MSKWVRVRDLVAIRTVNEGAESLIIGQRRFRLVQDDQEPHDVTNPREIAAIRKALDNSRPLLSTDEARAYVQDRLQKQGKRLSR